MSEAEPLNEENDAVIGAAFRRSVALILFCGALTGVYALYHWWSAVKPAVTTAEPVVPPQTRAESAVTIPAMPFKDITTEAGITFVHENGAYGDKLLPETMGGGCAFLDYEGDGDQDLLFVNSAKWPFDPKPGKDPAPTMALYANDGSGKFTDVTKSAGLDVTFYGQGVAAGDYDGDGDIDLFFTAVGLNHLYRNDNGHFTDIASAARVAGNEAQWSTSCGWFDYDHDGDLDLFVSNYIVWTKQFDLDQNFQLTGIGRAYGRPQNFPGTFPYLYRNDGNDQFNEVGEEAGLHVKNPATSVPTAKSLGVTFADLDDDGWLDIIVANDTVQNLLFHNLKNGKFEEISQIAGIAFDNDGNARGAMGIDCAHFRNSSQIGIAIGNFANEMTALYVSQGDGLQFIDEAVATGLGPQSRLELKFGTLFVDVDLDGRVDLVSANGHLEEDINRVQPSQFYEQPPHLFWNCGPKEATEFLPVPVEKCGADFVKRMVGRGAAAADIDADGDLDLVFAASGQSPRLLRNDQKLDHHWLRVQLKGVKPNTAAIGARLELHTGRGVQTAAVMPTRGYLSQSELPVTFGLGETTSYQKLVVRWPDGRVEERKDVPADRLTVLTQPSE